MARLPQPGGDSGNWGDILNDYLSQTHKADGTLKDNSVGSTQLTDDAVTSDSLASASVAASSIVDGAVGTVKLSDDAVTEAKLADTAVTLQKLDASLQSQVTNALQTISLVGSDLSISGGNTVSLPGGGITKTGLAAVTMSPNAAVGTASEWHERYPFSLPVATTRWRVRITNGSSTAGNPIPGVNVAIGRPGYNAIGREDGTATSLTSIATGVTVPGSGDWVSDWVTDATLQWKPSQTMLLSLGFIAVAGPYTKGVSLCFAKIGAGAAAKYATVSESGFTYISAGIFDIRMEYDYTQTSPEEGNFGVLWGHSVDVVPPSPTDLAVQPALSGDRVWASLLAANAGYTVANLAISGATLLDFATASWRMARLPTNVEQQVDFGIITLGGNDLLQGGSFATLQSRLASVVNLMRSRYPNMKRLYFANQFPVGSFSSYGPCGILTADVAAGATSFICDTDLGVSGSVSFGEGGRMESRTITARSGSAPGPYTYTISAGFTNRHFTTEIVAGPMERVRQQYNEYTASLPFGASGAIDLVRPLQWNAKPYRLDYRYDTGDGVHWLNAAHSAIASHNSLR